MIAIRNLVIDCDRRGTCTIDHDHDRDRAQPYREYLIFMLANRILLKNLESRLKMKHGSYGSVDGFQQAQTESGENRLYEVCDTPAPASAKQ